MTGPFVFQWTGAAMVPIRRHRQHCAESFVGDEYYEMEARKPRRESSHRHYFAALKEAWTNLPHQYDGEVWAQSDVHLRHHALIQCGWVEATKIVQCGSNNEAVRWAAIMAPMKPYSVVTAVRSTVIEHTSKSQSKAAMGAKDFMKSKWMVLDYVADLCGITRDELEHAAKQSAQ